MADAKTTTKIETPAGTAKAEFKADAPKTGFEKTGFEKGAFGKTDAFAFPSFDANEVTDMYRQYADQATRQAKDAYGKIKNVTEEAQATMENTFETMQNAGVALGLKAIDAMRTNAELGLAHVENVIKAKSASEVIELQSAYARQQAETAMDQVKSLQETGTKVAEDMAAPVKEQLEKAARDMKAAA